MRSDLIVFNFERVYSTRSVRRVRHRTRTVFYTNTGCRRKLKKSNRINADGADINNGC